MALYSFNAADHNSQVSFLVLPKGWYQAKLIESELKATNGGGQMLTFTAEILMPEWAKGRKVFLRYNTVNKSDETVRIAHEQLGGMSVAIGIPKWDNTEQLHERPFHLKLKVTPANADYEEGNDAAGYDSISVNRALAKQAPAPGSIPAVGAPAFPTAPGAAPTVAFPGAVAAPVVAPAVTFPGAVAQPVAQPAAVQQPAAQPVVTQWAAAPAQPWDQQQAAAVAQAAQVAQPAQAAPVELAQQAVVTPAPMPPVQQVVQTPPAETAPVVAQPVQPVVAQPAPVAEVAQPAATQPVAASAPVQGAPMTMPWAGAVVAPVQPAAQAQVAAAVAQPTEPHPAQAMTPPWTVDAQGNPVAPVAQ